MNVDYPRLEDNLLNGTFRQELEAELIVGFRMIQESGERLPLASYYAAQIAEIVNRNAPQPIDSELAYYVYKETLAAVEQARATVLGEDVDR